MTAGRRLGGAQASASAVRRLRRAGRRRGRPARATATRAPRILERALSGLGLADRAVPADRRHGTAREWFRTLTAGGIEGLVVKDAAGTYPTREGQRVWWKVKAKTTLDMIAVGITGPAAAPTSLVLAFPGEVDEDGEPHRRVDDRPDQGRGQGPAAALRPTGPRSSAPSPGGARSRRR